MSVPRGSWLSMAVVALLALLTWIAATGDLALVVGALGIGALGVRSALVTPEPAARSSTRILVVDVRHRDDDR